MRSPAKGVAGDELARGFESRPLRRPSTPALSSRFPGAPQARRASGGDMGRSPADNLLAVPIVRLAFGHDGVAEDGTLEVCAPHVGEREVGVGQIGVLQRGILEAGTP